MVSSITRSGRRRWTSEQRQRLLTRYHQSQLSQRDFAARHGLGLSTLSKWLRAESPAASPPVEFQEVVLRDPGARWAVEVVSPQGWIVRLQSASELPTLLQLLQALPC